MLRANIDAKKNLELHCLVHIGLKIIIEKHMKKKNKYEKRTLLVVNPICLHLQYIKTQNIAYTQGVRQITLEASHNEALCRFMIGIQIFTS